MRYGYKLGLLLMGVVAILATGCAHKKAPVQEPTVAANPFSGERVVYTNDSMTTNERVVVVHRGDDNSRRYYRDNNGKLYYVDRNGAIHDIDRAPKVERGALGLYYIIDDDNVSYNTDENGRLYYRDTSGRVMMIEDSGTGRVIDPLPILQSGSNPMVLHERSYEYCTDAWRRCMRQCDDVAGLSSKKNCLENCDYKREQCLKPY